MRLYEFKNQAGEIDVTVVTDGLGEQKRIFVTETPRGISVPGDMTPPSPNPNNDIIKMGFDFVAGTQREHLDFVRFALKNDLKLIQWNEGLNELSPIEVVEGYNSVFTVNPTEATFIKASAPDVTLTIVSTRTPWGESGAEEIPFFAEITKGADHFSFDPSTKNISAKDNTTGEDILGTLVLKQSYSEKQVVINLISEGA